MSNKGVAETIILVFLLGGLLGFAAGKASSGSPQQTTVVVEKELAE